MIQPRMIQGAPQARFFLKLQIKMIQGKAIMIQERKKWEKIDGNQQNDTIILVVRDCSGFQT